MRESVELTPSAMSGPDPEKGSGGVVAILPPTSPAPSCGAQDAQPQDCPDEHDDEPRSSLARISVPDSQTTRMPTPPSPASPAVSIPREISSTQ